MEVASLPSSLHEFERRARQTMPRVVYDLHFGVDDELGASDLANQAGFGAFVLRPRVLVDTSRRDLATEVLGRRVEIPVLLAPVGAHARAHPEGELASARAAATAGTVLALSTHASFSMEEVAKAATAPAWFQLYFLARRNLTEMLVRRAEDAGYAALVLTVDVVKAKRELDFRYVYNLPADRTLANFRGNALAERELGLTADSRWDIGWQKPDLTWADVDWLRSLTRLPLVIKGIQTAEDAELCVAHGVDGLVVSNHGGHGVQGGLPPVEILPEVVEAVRGQLEVYVDGGVRRGVDVLKALGLGARAVLIGRPLYWGLSVGNGEAGVARVLEILRQELDLAMAECGVDDLRSVDRTLVRRR